MKRRIRLRTEVTVETHRVVLAVPGVRELPECGQCGPGSPMVSLAVAAAVAGATVAAIRLAVAGGTLHFSCTDEGELLVCLGSVSRA